MARGRARGPGKRVVMNREALDAIRLGYADGLQAMGEAIAERARQDAPDAPPAGSGYVESFGAVTYVDGRKVAGAGTAPRGQAGRREGTVTIVGGGFPGRFLELGTVKMAPRPHWTPAMAAEVSNGADYVAPKVRERLQRVRR